MKQKILVWLGLLSSIVFLYIALQDIALDQFVVTVRQAHGLPILGALALVIGLYFVRSLRWRSIIKMHHDVPYLVVLRIQMIGFFCNNLLPARAGEVVRSFLLKREIGTTKSYALGTIMVERVSDLAVLLTLIILSFYRIPEAMLPPVVVSVRRLAFIVLLLFVTAMVFLVWGRTWVVGEMECIFGLIVSARRARSLAEKFDNFSQGLQALRNPMELLAVLGLSFTIWGGMAVVYYLVFQALSFLLPFSAVVTTVALVNLGGLVPSSPGYVGTYEFFVVKSLDLFGIAGGAAFAFALVSRLLWYLIETVVGFVALWYTHLGVKQLFGFTRLGEDDADPGSLKPPVPPVSVV